MLGTRLYHVFYFIIDVREFHNGAQQQLMYEFLSVTKKKNYEENIKKATRPIHTKTFSGLRMM